MSQENPSDAEEIKPSPAPADSSSISPDDALPPVEEPGAGFLLQLFIVPAVIVLVIVMVWLMFQWIARGSDDPQLLIKQIATPTEARFQAAHHLANVLRDKRFEEFRSNSEAAEELAEILRRELEKGGVDESAINLRIYLCRALGEFEVENGMDALLLAAQTQNDDAEVLVRQHALAAIAIRAEHAASPTSSDASSQTIDHPGLTEAMLEMADDEEYIVRGATAVTMSWLGQEELLDKLREMLDDPYPDVRFNAAINCARLGDERAIDVLVEMLDPENAGIEAEKGGKNEKERAMNRANKRAKILFNAIRAVELLESTNQDADLSKLGPPLKALGDSDIEKPIKIQATGMLNRMKENDRL